MAAIMGLKNFMGHPWITEGKIERVEELPYTGNGDNIIEMGDTLTGILVWEKTWPIQSTPFKIIFKNNTMTAEFTGLDGKNYLFENSTCVFVLPG